MKKAENKGNARETALLVLERSRRAGAWSEDALTAEISRAGLDTRDAALASQLCYGVLQNRTLCDFYIDCYSSVKTTKMEPKLLDILRLSVYQILLLDRIPDFSAVSEGVALCKKSGLSRAAGLCNAVLRRICENKNALPEIPDAGTAENLSIRYSHPKWLAEEMIECLGFDGAENFFAANNTPIPVTAQVNTLKISADELAERLVDKGIEVQKHTWMPDCLNLRGTGELSRLDEFRDGLFYVQDAAAKLAVMASGAAPGMEILDCCAAPGGKSFAAAIAMKNTGKIISCDINAKKLPRIDAGAKRLEIDIINTSAADARKSNENFNSRFDVVFADVPCSGLGVIRKKPEIRYKTREELKRLPEIQLDILKAASKCVKPGGTLVYSTCTVLKEENERVISEFLENTAEFEPQNFRMPFSAEPPERSMLTLWPHINDSDGFFICRLGRSV